MNRGAVINTKKALWFNLLSFKLGILHSEYLISTTYLLMDNLKRGIPHIVLGQGFKFPDLIKRYVTDKALTNLFRDNTYIAVLGQRFQFTDWR